MKRRSNTWLWRAQRGQTTGEGKPMNKSTSRVWTYALALSSALPGCGDTGDGPSDAVAGRGGMANAGGAGRTSTSSGGSTGGEATGGVTGSGGIQGGAGGAQAGASGAGGDANAGGDAGGDAGAGGVQGGGGFGGTEPSGTGGTPQTGGTYPGGCGVVGPANAVCPSTRPTQQICWTRCLQPPYGDLQKYDCAYSDEICSCEPNGDFGFWRCRPDPGAGGSPEGGSGGGGSGASAGGGSEG